jgi:putative holliday junction resolvase
MLETQGGQDSSVPPGLTTKFSRHPAAFMAALPRGAREDQDKMRRGVRLALDWGDARIGVAACDKDGVLAYPVSTVRAGPEEITDLVVAIGEYEPIEVLVGFPRSLSGGEGPAAGKARERAKRLAGVVRVPVRLVDERLTTVTASQRLSQGGKRVKEQRGLIDAASAVAILEQALAFEQSQGIPPGELVSGDSRPGP